ncbi:hypothetical protein PENSPDRAFT_656148 [Peniophora sp. CONT]|nr:hypothetical protein PENSPDRAFT_656148 [Peniophora sp. CONT]
MEPIDGEGYAARPRPILGLARPWVLQGAVFCPSPWVTSRRPPRIRIALRGLPQPTFSTQSEEEECSRRRSRQYVAYRAAARSAGEERSAESLARKVDRTKRVWYISRLRAVRQRIQPTYDEYMEATKDLMEFVERAAVAYTPSTLAERVRAVQEGGYYEKQ